MSIPPKCDVCQANHWPYMAHEFSRNVIPNANKPLLTVSKPMANAEPDMANSMANTYQYRDKDKRKVYQRDLMRKRRATPQD